MDFSGFKSDILTNCTTGKDVFDYVSDKYGEDVANEAKNKYKLDCISDNSYIYSFIIMSYLIVRDQNK